MHIPTIERSGAEFQPAPASRLPAEVPVRIEAVEAPLAGLVVKGTLLSVITLGIYRFWYRTALRRFYWHNTRLGGDAFEYTGTGKELFVGFLIALAIVLPLYFVVTLIGLFGGQYLGPVIASLLGSIILPAVVQVLVYRARRYRLTRTRFRGLRFHQTGTGLGYLFHTVKWLLLTALTLGILFPYLRRALERYKTENTWFGSAQGAFNAPAKPLMKSWLLVWVIGVLAVGLSVGSAVYIGTMQRYAGSANYMGGANTGALVTALYLLIPAGVLFLLLPFAWIRYRTIEFRTFVAGTSFGEIALASDLKTRSVVWVWLRYYLALLGMGIGAMMIGWAIGIEGNPMADVDGPSVNFEGAAASLLFLGYILAAILATETLLRRRLWAMRLGSITLTNFSALDSIVQTGGQEAIGVGEAFDTGFDIAG